MNKQTLKILTTTASILLLTSSAILAQSPTPTEETATSSATIEEKVKENVMKLLQEARVKGDSDILRRKTAMFGTLKSVANTTLSIDTIDGIQLASASSATTYVRLPGSKAVTFEDLAIDDYIIALGFVNGSDVLDARRILTQKEPPQDPETVSFFGLAEEYSTKTFELIIRNPNTNESKTIMVSRNTDVYKALTDGTKEDIKRTEEIIPGTPVLTIYSIAKQKTADTITPIEILLKNIAGNQEASPSAEPTQE